MFGGLQIAGNATPTIAPAAGAKHTQGWAAIAASAHGDQSVTASVASSRLTLKQGTYLVTFNGSVQTEDVSGTSGDDAGIVTFQIFKGGSAVAGTKGRVDYQDQERPAIISCMGIIEIAESEVEASTPTNYVEMYAIAADASGNDITVLEAQFFAIRLN